MKDTQNITIVLLAVTACILGAMLVGTYVGTSQSARGEASFRHMGWIFATGRVSAQAEGIYIVDHETNRLNVYFLNVSNNAIEFLATEDLEKAFQVR